MTQEQAQKKAAASDGDAAATETDAEIAAAEAAEALAFAALASNPTDPAALAAYDAALDALAAVVPAGYYMSEMTARAKKHSATETT